MTFTDVWRAQVTTAGSTLSNVGTVTVRLATGPVTLCSLPDAEGVSRHSHFIIPAGYTGFMSDINIGLGGAGGAGVGRVALNILDPSNVIRNISDQYITSNSGPIYMPAVGNLELSAGSQIWFDAYSETANSELSVSYTIILVKGVFV